MKLLALMKKEFLRFFRDPVIAGKIPVIREKEDRGIVVFPGFF